MSQSSQTDGTAGTAVAGPFTVRDTVVGAGIVLLFLSSVMPLQVLQGIGVNLWNSGGLFQLGLGILLPAVVLVLFVVRRLAPQTPLRVGSLSVDQFASVVASLALAFYFLTIVTVFSVSGVIGFIGAVVLFAGTVCARWIPQLAADFAGRPETVAHPVARDAVPGAPRPKQPKPATGQPGANQPAAGQPAAQGGAARKGTAKAGAVRTDEARPERRGAGVPAGSAAHAPSGAHHTGAQQPSTGQFAAPSGKGAAGVAGAAAAAHAMNSPENGTGTATIASGRDTDASPISTQRAEDLEPDDSVSPGAADGEAVGIPVTADASGSATARAAASSAGGVARDVGYSARTVVGGSATSAGGRQSREPAETGRTGAANLADGTGEQGAAERPDESAVPAGGAVGGAAAEPTGAGAVGGAGAKPTGAGATATPAAADQTATAATTAMPSVGEKVTARAVADAASASAPISATREHYEEEEAEGEYEAFWFAVGRTRPVLDENTGQVMFTVEPGSWILALQDRGDEFLVQHTDGRVGVLRDLTNIERA